MSRNRVMVAVLVVVIGVCAYFVAKHVGSATNPKLPDYVLQAMIEYMDKDTMETVTLKHADVLKLKSENGYLMNPKTKAFSLTPPMNCAACGKKIPSPQMPQPVETPGGPAAMPPTVQEQAAWEARQVCPLCKQGSYPRPGIPPVAPSP